MKKRNVVTRFVFSDDLLDLRLKPIHLRVLPLQLKTISSWILSKSMYASDDIIVANVICSYLTNENVQIAFTRIDLAKYLYWTINLKVVLLLLKYLLPKQKINVSFWLWKYVAHRYMYIQGTVCNFKH